MVPDDILNHVYPPCLLYDRSLEISFISCLFIVILGSWICIAGGFASWLFLHTAESFCNGVLPWETGLTWPNGHNQVNGLRLHFVSLWWLIRITLSTRKMVQTSGRESVIDKQTPCRQSPSRHYAMPWPGVILLSCVGWSSICLSE